MFDIDEETTNKFIEQLAKAEETAPAANPPLPAPKAKEGKKQKSFADRLAAFFDDSSAEEFGGNQLTAIKRSKTTAAATSTRPLVGIEQLLNRTLIDDEEQSAHSRRITFTLPDDKLNALKELARSQGKPLSDLVRQLIEFHLEEQPPRSKKKTKA